MSLKSPFHVQRWGLALILVLAPSIAFGLIFRLGPDARALVDINLAYGLQWRVQDRDDDIIGEGNGGNPPRVGCGEERTASFAGDDHPTRPMRFAALSTSYANLGAMVER